MVPLRRLAPTLAIGWAVQSAPFAAAQVLPPAAEPGAPLPIERPRAPSPPPPAVELPPTAPGRVPQGAEGLRFTLVGVTTEGISAFPAERVAALWAGRLGTEISVADVFALADALTALYRDAGFVLSRAVVPPQRIEDGRIRLQVVEGFVGAVVVEGELGRVRALVDRYLDRIVAARPVNLADIERYLLLVNDVPGLRLSGVLRPGGEPGAAELVVAGERTPFDGFATVNNRGSDFAGPWTGAVGAGTNSLTSLGERLEVLLFSAWPHREQRYGQVLGSARLGGEGLRVEGSASYGPSEPGSVLADLDVRSEATRLAAGVAYPLRRGRSFSLWLEAGYEWLLERSEIAGTRLFRDRIDTAELGGRIALDDPLGGRSTLAGGLRQGLGLPGTTRQGDDGTSRPDASGVFTALVGEATRRQKLVGPFELALAAAGQYARDELLSGAEVKYGGIGFLRGYPPAELSGDSGFAVATELRATVEPATFPAELVQGYAFFDYGRVWNNGADLDARQTLRSLGIGVRWLPVRFLSFEVELAQGLDRQLSGDDAGDRPTKLFFTATALF